MGMENQSGPGEERAEVYERIPWEMLDRKQPDRQWVIYAVAGAVVLGAVAYSFMSNRPPQPVEIASAPVATTPTVPATQEPSVAFPPAVTTPVVVTEADLYAVDPERAVDRAVGHAEWFVAEYFTDDGSALHEETLLALMPTGVPLPTSPEGTRVFVESVRTVEVVEVGPLSHRISVLVRYLVSTGQEDYRRQPAVVATVELVESDTGLVIAGPPELRPAAVPASEIGPLLPVPPEIMARVNEEHPGAEAVGAWPLESGMWRVVLMLEGGDGITRPVSVLVP